MMRLENRLIQQCNNTANNTKESYGWAGFSGLDTWFSGLDTWFSGLDTWFSGLDTWFWIHGSLVWIHL